MNALLAEHVLMSVRLKQLAKVISIKSMLIYVLIVVHVQKYVLLMQLAPANNQISDKKFKLV